jgi:hypothetical protein
MYGNEGPQKRLVNRRTEFYARWISGEELKDIVRICAGKYKVKEGALYVDWNRRNTWGIVLAEPEEEFVVQDYLQEVRQIKAGLWKDTKSKDPNVRHKAHSKLADIAFKQLEANQALGRVHREPVKIAVEEQVDKLYESIKKVTGSKAEEQEKMMEALLEFSHSSN